MRNLKVLAVSATIAAAVALPAQASAASCAGGGKPATKVKMPYKGV